MKTTSGKTICIEKKNISCKRYPFYEDGVYSSYNIVCTSAGTKKDLAGNKSHWSSENDPRVINLNGENLVPCYHSHEWMMQIPYGRKLNKGGSFTCSAAFHFGMLKDLMTPLDPEFKRAVSVKRWKRKNEDILFCYQPDAEKFEGETLIFYNFAYNKSEGKLYELFVKDNGELEKREEWKNYEDFFVDDDGWYQLAKFDPSNILVRTAFGELPRKQHYPSDFDITKCLYQKYVELESLRF